LWTRQAQGYRHDDEDKNGELCVNITFVSPKPTIVVVKLGSVDDMIYAVKVVEVRFDQKIRLDAGRKKIFQLLIQMQSIRVGCEQRLGLGCVHLSTDMIDRGEQI